MIARTVIVIFATLAMTLSLLSVPQAAVACKPKTMDIQSNRLMVTSIDGLSTRSITKPSYKTIRDVSWRPNQKQLAFVANDYPKSVRYLCLINDNGTGLTRLASTPIDSTAPISTEAQWSADGQKIVFIKGTTTFGPGPSFRMDQSKGLLVSNVGSGKLRRIVNNLPTNTKFSWAPDSNAVIFTNTKGIYKISVNGRNKTLIHKTRFPERPGRTEFGGFALSPDGSSIAIGVGGDKYKHLYTIDTDGKNLKRLTRKRLKFHSLSWSPDSKKIAFMEQRWRQRQREGLSVINADGSHLIRLTRKRTKIRDFSWSPDGEKIAYAKQPGSKPTLYVVGANGSNRKRLIDQHATLHEYAWSPDGRTIAYSESRRGPRREPHTPDEPPIPLYMVNVDGSGRKLLSDEINTSSDLAWSPDGSEIAFVDFSYK